MKKLERQEMKKIKGGIVYHCILEYTDGSCEDVTITSDTTQHARVAAIGAHSNVYSVNCAPAGEQ